MQKRFRAYVAAIEGRDRPALLECFTDDVVQIDPYPAPANIGKDTVGSFFDQMWSLAERLEFIVGRVVTGGDRGVFPFTVRSTVGGVVVEVDAVDVMTFTEDGLISEITAYVDMAGMRSAG
jgi:ketosteroid isomerase-like protein